MTNDNKKRTELSDSALGQTYSKMYHALMDSPNHARLSASARALLQDLYRQYNGRNNGDLSAAMSVLKKYGWSATATIARATDCLLHYGFIVKTRQGTKKRCNLYALTWLVIDECGGKLDVKTDSFPSHKWQQEAPKWNPKY